MVSAEQTNPAVASEVNAPHRGLAKRSRAALKLGESANERQGGRMTWDITRCNSVHPAQRSAVAPCTLASGVSAWPPAR
jgi:hypothetical protein